jgi:hypothetical protein
LWTAHEVFGTIAREVALLAEFRLTPTAALAVASTAARRFPRPDADLSEDRPADLVTYDAGPRDDPQVLARPAAIIAQETRIR